MAGRVTLLGVAAPGAAVISGVALILAEFIVAGSVFAGAGLAAWVYVNK